MIPEERNTDARVELLVSCMNSDGQELADKMGIRSDAVIVNQCDDTRDSEFALPDGRVRVFCRAERGVGRSRNLALANARGDYCLFSDEDIVYEEDYAKHVITEFEAHPEADGLLFQVEVDPYRKTYQNDSYHKVGRLNYGRYPAYSMAFRREKLQKSGVRFSLLFGGGAPYSNGEDSLFLKDCLSAGLKLYATPVCLGKEVPRPSTWFSGYHEKFFYDRGVLYHYLYGNLAWLWGLRFTFCKRKVMCLEIPWTKAYALLRQGIKKGKQIHREENNEA